MPSDYSVIPFDTADNPRHCMQLRWIRLFSLMRSLGASSPGSAACGSSIAHCKSTPADIAAAGVMVGSAVEVRRMMAFSDAAGLDRLPSVSPSG